MILEKGMLISTDNFWYVVVGVRFSEGKTFLQCICDHANNRFVWEPSIVHSYLSLKEIGRIGYDGWPERIPETLIKRKIPYDVLAEVLCGKEDDRFNDYDEML